MKTYNHLCAKRFAPQVATRSFEAAQSLRQIVDDIDLSETAEKAAFEEETKRILPAKRHRFRCIVHPA